MITKLQRLIICLLVLAGLTTKTFAQSWQTVGQAGGFSAGNVAFTSIEFNKTGEPYVAYRDAANNLKTTVMKFNGTTWVNVGAAGFSAGKVGSLDISLAFNPTNGEPYVAYSDSGNSIITVMKFNGSNWINVGSAGFAQGLIFSTSLAFNNIGEPYVSYGDRSYFPNTYASVMKFDGTKWVNVGAAGFSMTNATYTSLAFNPINDEPYVAYGLHDPYHINSIKATVMRFTNSASTNELQENITTVYPNPANNLLHIDISNTANTAENTNITVVDITGKTIATHQLQTGSNTIDISKLSNGTYFIKTEQGGSVKFIKK